MTGDSGAGGLLDLVRWLVLTYLVMFVDLWNGGGFHVGGGVGGGCDGVVARVSVRDQVLWWIGIGIGIGRLTSVTNYLVLCD
ncbi:Hypothetical predicted protein [Olea europaea subsp. europaea]|uniref:Uncharacterized protein n=1 Tax=Olea europaea subsp. europaea TaxID=158383 RepID=A0A8S0UE19_OLEEU|nr:Hypothetical predicted protein [Olea europaea subsp. europaea]